MNSAERWVKFIAVTEGKVGNKWVEFAVYFVIFAIFFFFLDIGLQNWQGLELFPSGGEGH